MSGSFVALYRELWAEILGELGTGTDLYAEVLRIAPEGWDADLEEASSGTVVPVVAETIPESSDPRWSA